MKEIRRQYTPSPFILSIVSIIFVLFTAHFCQAGYDCHDVGVVTDDDVSIEHVECKSGRSIITVGGRSALLSDVVPKDGPDCIITVSILGERDASGSWLVLHEGIEVQISKAVCWFWHAGTTTATVSKDTTGKIGVKVTQQADYTDGLPARVRIYRK